MSTTFTMPPGATDFILPIDATEEQIIAEAKETHAQCPELSYMEIEEGIRATLGRPFPDREPSHEENVWAAEARLAHGNAQPGDKTMACDWWGCEEEGEGRCEH